MEEATTWLTGNFTDDVPGFDIVRHSVSDEAILSSPKYPHCGTADRQSDILGVPAHLCNRFSRKVDELERSVHTFHAWDEPCPLMDPKIDDGISLSVITAENSNPPSTTWAMVDWASTLHRRPGPATAGPESWSA